MEGDPEDDDLDDEHVGSPLLLLGALFAVTGEYRHMAMDVSCDTVQSVQAGEVPNRHEVLTEKEGSEEDGHAEPLDDVVGREQAQRNVVHRALAVGVSAQLVDLALLEPVVVGVHIDG